MSFVKNITAFAAALAMTAGIVAAPISAFADNDICSDGEVSAEMDLTFAEETVPSAEISADPETEEVPTEEIIDSDEPEVEDTDSAADEDIAVSEEMDRMQAAEKSAPYEETAVTVGKPTFKKGYTSTSRSVKFSWNAVSGADGYYIYRYSAFAPVWLRIADVTGSTTSYTSNNLPQGKYYNFRIKAYKLVNGKKVFSEESASLMTATKPTVSRILSLTPSSNKVKVTWNKISCSGYELYRLDGSTWRKAKTITDPNVNTYSVSGLEPETAYTFKIRAYMTDQAGGKVYNSYSDTRKVTTTADPVTDRIDYYESSSTVSRLNSVKLGSSKTSYVCYDTQGSSTVVENKYTLSSDDIATLKKFAQNHFTSGMTQAQKVDYTMQWINQNVAYADGNNGRPEYSDIWACSHVDAVFNKKAGQCIQYNGALVAMMAYLGYDVQLVKGYRGYNTVNKWQHYWGEVKINGETYVMEAGVYTDSSTQEQMYGWYFCAATYAETHPWSWNAFYIKNGKLY